MADRNAADLNKVQTEMQKYAADMGLNFTRVFMQNADNMVRLNLSFAESTLNAATRNAEAIARAKDPSEAVALYQQMVQSLLESAINYGNSVYGANSKASTQITEVIEQGFNGIAQQVGSAIDTVAEQPGASPSQVVDAVKTTAASATAAISEMSKAARKMAEVAEANFTAMQSATASAMKVNGRPS